MKKRKNIAIYLLPALGVMAFFACMEAVFAQDLQVSASVNQTNIPPGQEFTYTLRISGESMQGLSSPQLPSFENFEILSGPNTSQSFQFINGAMSRELVYSVILRCLKPGEYTIGPSVVKTGGTEIKSEEIKIVVAQGTSQNMPSSLKEENIPSPSASDADLRKYLEGKIFFRTEVDNKTPYVGQPIVASYTLYILKGLPVSSVNLNEPLPQFKEFLKEDLYFAQHLSFRDVRIDDKAYQAALIKKILLSPTKTGRINLDSMTLNIGIRIQRSSRNRRSLFDDPFFDDSFFDPFGRSGERALLSSSVVELDVQPLPTPKPEDFTGTVGNYALSAEVDRNKATLDDLITLSLKLSGSGIVDSALEPRIPPLEGFEVYETKARSEKKITGSVPGGTKIFDYVLRPRKTGDLEIPAISHSIFNPEKKEYVKLTTEAIRIPVSPGTATTPLIISSSAPRGSSSEVVEINADINYIKSAERLSPKGGVPLIASGWYLGIQSLPVLFAILSFFVNRRRIAMESDRGFARRIRARGIAGKRLKNAERLLAQNNPDAFYLELASALRGFFGDKLNREAPGLTIEALERLLEEKGIAKEEREGIERLLETADAARYAPASLSREDMRKHYNDAVQIIQDLGKRL
ncbi:protein BatD [Candidatus Sumerlaeota bacterium]|nr:protein BatD [Candidatus Sumerlaeota bacterium]